VVFLIGVVLTIGLFGWGIYKRWSGGPAPSSDYLNKLFFESLGLGTALVALGVTSWVLGSFVIRGSSLESNLPPGVSIETVLGLMVVGAVMTAINTFVSYKDRVYPGVRNTWPMEDSEEPVDPGPIQLGPMDRPG
jgi:hypothetical protein